ncbi:MAG TPA: hypothetical protein VH107_06355 [Lacipirellulaceae bacterium]|nr:hypothetical protein [Lacipirellulaceae bacterium]
MFTVGHADQREYGGVGVMVDPPNVNVAILPANAFSAQGSHSGRVTQFVAEIASRWELPELPNCEIDVQSPVDHSGLGVGTQLGLAVALGLRHFLERPALPIESLAASVGRGGRSAVGTHGFEKGGLIVDAGKLRGERLGQLFRRIEMPRNWRFVLVQATNRQGLAGVQEAEAFARLPPVPKATTSKLWRVVTEDMIPAVEAADCAGFGEAVYEFGRLAGACFAPAQGGTFASPSIERLVNAIREFGVAGAGQSSWGPTVFAVVPSDAEAASLAAWLRNQLADDESEIMVAAPNNCGATLRS